VAENKDEGIGVDTHVHRISNRLGWAKSTNPNETEEQLQQLFPVKYWNEINLGLVGFGQILCSAKNPMCNKCPVWRECPSSMVKSDI
jgi:endonuclease-3